MHARFRPVVLFVLFCGAQVAAGVDGGRGSTAAARQRSRSRCAWRADPETVLRAFRVGRTRPDAPAGLAARRAGCRRLGRGREADGALATRTLADVPIAIDPGLVEYAAQRRGEPAAPGRASSWRTSGRPTRPPGTRCFVARSLDRGRSVVRAPCDLPVLAADERLCATPGARPTRRTVAHLYAAYRDTRTTSAVSPRRPDGHSSAMEYPDGHRRHAFARRREHVVGARHCASRHSPRR